MTLIQKLEKLKTNVIDAVFDSKLAQANVITKEILMKKLMRLKSILKNYKHLIGVILLVKVILEKMVHKVI